MHESACCCGEVLEFAVVQGTPFARQNAEVMSECLTEEEEAELKRLLERLTRAEDRALPGL